MIFLYRGFEYVAAGDRFMIPMLNGVTVRDPRALIDRFIEACKED